MVYITGREKDIIIRGGRNISPYELEEAVGDMPGMRRGCVAVFGSMDAASGTERIVVLAETRQSGAGTHEGAEERINELAISLIAAPVDDIVLAPPAHRAEDLQRQDPARRRARVLRARPGVGEAAGGLAAVRAPGARRRRAAAAPQLAHHARRAVLPARLRRFAFMSADIPGGGNEGARGRGG